MTTIATNTPAASGSWRDPEALRTLRARYAAGSLEAEYPRYGPCSPVSRSGNCPPRDSCSPGSIARRSSATTPTCRW